MVGEPPGYESISKDQIKDATPADDCILEVPSESDQIKSAFEKLDESERRGSPGKTFRFISGIKVNERSESQKSFLEVAKPTYKTKPTVTPFGDKKLPERISISGSSEGEKKKKKSDQYRRVNDHVQRVKKIRKNARKVKNDREPRLQCQKDHEVKNVRNGPVANGSLLGDVK